MNISQCDGILIEKNREMKIVKKYENVTWSKTEFMIYWGEQKMFKETKLVKPEMYSMYNAMYKHVAYFSNLSLLWYPGNTDFAVSATGTFTFYSNHYKNVYFKAQN